MENLTKTNETNVIENKYVFLQNTNENRDNDSYLCITESRIETIRLSDCYNNNTNNKVGAHDAGDHVSFELTKEYLEKILAFCEEEDIDFEGAEGDNITVLAYEQESLFDFIVDKLKIESEGIEVEGFNYWDGSNWKSIIIYSDYETTDWDTLDNESELYKEFVEAIELSRFISENQGQKYYQYKHIDLTESFWQGHWEDYTIEKNERETQECPEFLLSSYIDHLIENNVEDARIFDNVVYSESDQLGYLFGSFIADYCRNLEVIHEYSFETEKRIEADKMGFCLSDSLENIPYEISQVIGADYKLISMIDDTDGNQFSEKDFAKELIKYLEGTEKELKVAIVNFESDNHYVNKHYYVYGR